MHFRFGSFQKIVCFSTFLLVGAIVFVGFQNFTILPLDRLKLRRLDATISAAYAAGGDIRKIAPRRPASLDESSIALPQEGQDLNSVGQAWLTRQARLLTNGEDEKILREVNKSLQRSWKGTSTETTAATEDTEVAMPEEPSYLSSIRLTAFNRIQFGSADTPQLSCSINGSSIQLDLSHSLSHTVNVNVHHESSTNANSLQLQYVW